MFCTNCGKPLITGAAFCQNCGSRAAPPVAQTSAPVAFSQPPPQPAYTPGPGDDETRLLLQTTRKLSLASAMACHIVFKQSRLVLAHLSPSLQKAETARLQERLKAQNVGVLKRTAEQMRFWAAYHERYFTMPANAILAEDPANLAVDYGQIAVFDFFCYSTDTNFNDNTGTSRGGKLHITLTNGDTLKFTHQQTHSRGLHDGLASLLGPKLKYRK